MASFSERLAYVLTFDTTSGVKSLQKFGSTADKELSKADKRSQKLWATTEKVSAGMLALAGVAGVGLGKMAMGALDTQQNVEALRQVVGDIITEDMEGWAEGAANGLGLSKNAAVDNVTAFAQLGKMAGFTGDGLAKMSQDLVILGSDFAAFKNVSPEKAIQDIRSAFSGSVEVMRKYGIFLDDMTLKQAFFRETGIKVTGTLTGQQKVIAVNSELFRQGADMVGQFARESDTLAGQQPILMANLRNLSDEVGSGFLPTMTGAVSILADLTSAANEANPELLRSAGRFGAAGVAALSFVGSVGLSAAAVRRAAGAFRNFSGAMKTATLAAGAVGVVVAAAGAVYADYSKRKAEAAAVTASFTEALKAERDGVEGATDGLVAGELSVAGFTDAMRALDVGFGDVQGFIEGEVNPTFDALFNELQSNMLAGEMYAQSMGLTEDQLHTFVLTLGSLRGGLSSATDEMARLDEVAQLQNEHLIELGEAGAAPLSARFRSLTERQKEATEAAEANIKAAEDQAEASRDAADALLDQADAQLALADKGTAARLANLKLSETIVGSEEALAGLTEGTYEYESALAGQVSEATSAAAATAALAEEQAEANGETLSAAQRTDVLNKSLLAAARAADGPLRDALVATIAQMNGIGEGVVGEIVLIPDTAAAEAALSSASRPRSTQITAAARTAAAVEALRIATLPREVQVYTRFVDPGQNPFAGPGGGTQNIPARVPSRPSTPAPKPSVPFFYADGTSHHPGGMAVVGEEGPELVNLPGGSQVLPADETVNAFTAVGESAPPLNVTFSGDIYGVPSDEFWDLAADKLKRRLAGRA